MKCGCSRHNSHTCYDQGVQYASGSVQGVGSACHTTIPTATTSLGLGLGLKVSGCNAEVDLCGLAETVAQRTPGAAATILFCDEQGIGKVALSTLLAGLTGTPPTTPVYRLDAAVGGAITLKKDGVAVDTYQLCTLVAPCNTAGGGTGGTLPAYTFALSGGNYELLKDGVAVSTVPVPAVAGADYRFVMDGTGIRLLKDGVVVDSYPIASTCEGGGGTPANTPPVAVDNAYTTPQGVSLTITDLLANDSDADGNTLAIASVSTPTSGTATVVNSTTVQYVPAAGFVGIATFNYTITDGHGGAATAQVTVTVTSSGGGGGGNGGSNLL